jgi:hypothetical protein
MTGHGAKFSGKKDEAIAALLAQPTVASAALAAHVQPHTLSRWMKEPEFESVLRATRRAVLGQAIARLQKASGAAVTILLKVMSDPRASAAARLKAAEVVLRHAKAAPEMEDIQPRLKEAERAPQPAKAEVVKRTADERGGAPIAGHGAKIDRKTDEAIAALLTQRSVEEAAKEAKIGTQTLYRWIRQPEFDAAWREARRAAFGQASVRLQQAANTAVTTLLNIMALPGTPATTKVRAADLALLYGHGAMEEDCEERVAMLGYAAGVAEAVLRGDRRSFDEIARDYTKVAT